MVRTSEIAITRKFTSNKPLGLTFKSDMKGRLVFAKSNFNSNYITNLLNGCYPLYLVGYAKDSNECQCIQFVTTDGEYVAYSEYLKNLLVERIETFYDNASIDTPVTIYYTSITLLPDYGITTKFRTRLARAVSGPSGLGYEIRPMGNNSIFQMVEYVTVLMMYNSRTIKSSIRFLTSFIKNLENTHTDLKTLSRLKDQEKPPPIYHYYVTIQGSAELQIELAAKPSTDGWKRITVNGPPDFLNRYGITQNSNLIGLVDKTKPDFSDDVKIMDLTSTPISKYEEYMGLIKNRMYENTSVLLFLTSTDENAKANAEATYALYNYSVNINTNETIGIVFNPKNNKVTIDPANNPYGITNDSKLVTIVYNDKAVELNITNGLEKYKEFKERKDAIVPDDETTHIRLHFTTNDPIKAPKQQEEEPEPETEAASTGGKSRKTKRHHKKSRRHRKKSRRNKKTRISKY